MKIFCSYCSSQIFDSDRTCPKCGAPTKNSVVENFNEKKLVVLNTIDWMFNHPINWWDDVIGLAVGGGDFNLYKKDDKKLLNIWAIPGTQGRVAFKPPILDLRFKSDSSCIKIDANGNVKYISEGKAKISVEIFLKSDICVDVYCNTVV